MADRPIPSSRPHERRTWSSMLGDADAALSRAVSRRAPPAAHLPARVLGRFGDHAGGWLAVAALGAWHDERRREQWLRAGTTVLVAHGTAVALKRVVRRRRPPREAARLRGRLVSAHSFPSAHATSSMAAASAFSGLLPGPPVQAAAVSVAASRLVLGVHYPADVLAGAVLGTAVARAMGTRSRS